MNKVFLNILFFSTLLIAFGCDRDPQDLEGDEKAKLNAWIQVHGLESYKTPSGLYFIVENEGTGETPKDSNYLLFSYVIRNLDGVIFQTTYKDTALLYDYYGIYNKTTHYTPAYSVYIKDNFINKGVSEAFSQMRKGAKVRLVMPYSLASYISYGQNPYTSLIFDYELKEIVEDPVAYEQSLINDYMSKPENSGFVSIASDSIYYKKIKEGTAVAVNAKDTVRVNYIGRFLNDKDFVFDSNIDSVARANGFYSVTKIKPFEFIVGSKDVIAGYNIAVKQMKKGEKATFIIPSKSAYNLGKDKIPPYATLVFEIEVTDVNP